MKLLSSGNATSNITTCDSLIWNGTTYKNSGTYIHTNGPCIDSLVLDVRQSSSSIDQIVACDSLTWIDGITYKQSFSGPTYVLSNYLGCDSVVMLDLTINYSSFGQDTITACDSLVWIDGITYYQDNNSATYSLTNADGCDSIVTLVLDLNNQVLPQII